MTPVLVSRLPILAYPLDGGLSVRGRRLFGENKTVRGLAFGTCAAIATAWLLSMFADTLASYALVDYTAVDPLLFGGLAGLGALLGDAAKSAIKRQLDIAPGEPWIPFDQLDWIAGTFLFIFPLVSFTLPEYTLAFFVGGALHPVINIAGYLMGLKRNVF